MFKGKDDSFSYFGHLCGPGGILDAVERVFSSDVEKGRSSIFVFIAFPDVVSLFEGGLAVVVEMVDVLLDRLGIVHVEKGFSVGVVVLPRGGQCQHCDQEDRLG
jgi:hypothetical protein